MTFTEQQCKDTGITLAMPEDKAMEFFHYYNAQGWKFNSGQEIVNLKSAMWRWQRKGYEFENNKKTRLLPIPGKVCSTPNCKLPAVYIDRTGDYDVNKCIKCVPEEVKEFYE